VSNFYEIANNQDQLRKMLVLMLIGQGKKNYFEIPQSLKNEYKRVSHGRFSILDFEESNKIYPGEQ